MLVFSIFLLILSKSSDKNIQEDFSMIQPTLPRSTLISYIFVGETRCAEMKAEVDECKKNPDGSNCQGLPYELFCVDYDSDINDALARVDSKSKELVIGTHSKLENIDFNKLNNQMIVNILYQQNDDETVSQTKTSKLLQKFIDLPKKRLKNTNNINDKITKNGSPILSINANTDTANKVSYLLVIDMTIKINNFPIQIDNFELINCNFDTGSQKIEVNNLIVDAISHKMIVENCPGIINVNQYALKSSNIYQKYADNKGYISCSITFNIDHWSTRIHVYRDSGESTATGFFENEEETKVPYTFANVLTIFAISKIFYLNNLDNCNAKDANISLIYRPSIYETTASTYSTNYNLDIEISSNGEWTNSNDVNVYFTGFLNLLNLHTENIDKKIKFKKYFFKLYGGAVEEIVQNDQYQPNLPSPNYITRIDVALDQCSYMNEIYEVCKKDDRYPECENYGNEYICLENQNKLNDALINIKIECDKVIIATVGTPLNVDFSKLPRDIPVEIINADSSRYSSKFLENNNKISKKKEIKADEFPDLYISSNRKISYLSAFKWIIKSNTENLEIDNLYLEGGGSFATDTKTIKINNLVVDSKSHSSILNAKNDNTEITQYTLRGDEIHNEFENIGIKYQILFEDNQWHVRKKNRIDDMYIDYFVDVQSIVPYSFCEKLSVIGISDQFDFMVLDSTPKTLKPVNVTVIYRKSFRETFFDFLSSRILANEKYKIKLTTSGDWNNIEKTLSVDFGVFNKYIDIDTSGCNQKIAINKYDLSPYIYGSDSKVDSLDTISPTDLTSSKITEKFKDATDQTKDYFVTISNTNNEVIDADNLPLSSNHFIKLQNDAFINLKSGALHLLIDEPKSIEVTITNPNNVDLIIKNTDECNINLKTESSDQTVSVSSASELYGPLNIKLDNSVKSITFDSVILHQTGSISADKQITVKNFAVKKEADGEITNVVVANNFNIEQPATVKIKDVDFKGANINFNIQNYNKYKYNKPMISGNFGEEPSSIVIKHSENYILQPSSQFYYTLFQGTFSDSCDKWAQIVDTEGSLFKNKMCTPIDSNLNILQESKSLVTFVNEKTEILPPFPEKPTKEKDDDEDGDGDGNGGSGKGNNKKLTKAQIAGIVVGCIVGVAIIVAVIVIVVLKKKKGQQKSSDESANENPEL